MSVLDILSTVGARSTLVSAVEIIEATGLPRSTVFRRIRELCDKGYLYQDVATRRYGLGPQVLLLGQVARDQLSAGPLAAAPLLELVKDTGETATFSVVDVPWRICVAVFEAPSELRQVAQPGARYPLHLGAAGKIILAFLPEKLLSAVLEAHRIGRNEAAALHAQVEKIRKDGFAVTTGERVIGASTVAAPVFVGGEIYGSVAVVGPAERMQAMINRHADRVCEVAEIITGRLSARTSAYQPEPRRNIGPAAAR